MKGSVNLCFCCKCPVVCLRLYPLFMLCPNRIAYLLCVCVCVCVCVFVCGEGVFKGAAKVHFESLGPLSTHSLHPSNLRRYTTTIWPYVPCIGDVWGAGVWRILEKGSTGTVSITE